MLIALTDEVGAVKEAYDAPAGTVIVGGVWTILLEEVSVTVTPPDGADPFR